MQFLKKILQYIQYPILVQWPPFSEFSSFCCKLQFQSNFLLTCYTAYSTSAICAIIGCVCIDLLWTFLCGHQPLPPPAHLHRKHHRQIQRKEKDGDAPSLVLNRRQRLPVHGARYIALPSIILDVKIKQRCIFHFIKLVIIKITQQL